MEHYFKMNEVAGELHYYDEQFDFFDGNNEMLTCDRLFDEGKNEDDFPWNIKDFKKMGYGFTRALYECKDFGDTVYYDFRENENRIIITTDTFTPKECLIIINMIQKQQRKDNRWAYEVSIGTSDSDNFKGYHQEATVFGCWWNDFIALYLERMKEGKIKQITIELIGNMFWIRLSDSREEDLMEKDN